jgi:hydroxyacyl-ACP dehydratase HTD2-like protein with hotdog domain
MAAALLTKDVSEGENLPVLEKDVKPVTVVLGAMASRDWRPQHHDYKFATENNGLQDIFMNTPNLAAWFERYLTDWTGPKGRIGRIKFRMKDSIFPGDTMQFAGKVTGVESAGNGVSWVSVSIELTAGDKNCVSCDARIAVPDTQDANPWNLKGDDWKP